MATNSVQILEACVYVCVCIGPRTKTFSQLYPLTLNSTESMVETWE